MYSFISQNLIIQNVKLNYNCSKCIKNYIALIWCVLTLYLVKGTLQQLQYQV